VFHHVRSGFRHSHAALCRFAYGTSLARRPASSPGGIGVSLLRFSRGSPRRIADLWGRCRLILWLQSCGLPGSFGCVTLMFVREQVGYARWVSTIGRTSAISLPKPVRFLVNTVGTHTASSILRQQTIEQQVDSNCSINIRRCEPYRVPVKARLATTSPAESMACRKPSRADCKGRRQTSTRHRTIKRIVVADFPYALFRRQ